MGQERERFSPLFHSPADQPRRRSTAQGARMVPARAAACNPARKPGTQRSLDDLARAIKLRSWRAPDQPTNILPFRPVKKRRFGIQLLPPGVQYRLPWTRWGSPRKYKTAACGYRRRFPPMVGPAHRSRAPNCFRSPTLWGLTGVQLEWIREAEMTGAVHVPFRGSPRG